ncbi:MAG: peptidoglycan-binding domain-containing protein [Candidatus Eisenbacteria bacterium]
MRTERYAGLAVAAMALAICMLALGATSAGAEEVVRVSAAEASQHVGEVAEVCGQVASAAYLASVGGQPTFLNIERPYPDQVFTVVIWGSIRKQFDGRPENLFDGKSICVTGKIAMHQGTPQIVVDDPEQIVITTEARGTELRDFEKVFVKAVLSALGYDTNYGSGEWDQETVEAMIAFQENAGVTLTGEADPPTLRALADAAEEMPDSERDLVIRLLLFELARRQE